MHSLKHRLLLLVTLIFVCSTNAQLPLSSDSIARLNEEKIARVFHEKLNAFRKQQRRKPLEWNDTLARAAYNHTVWMTANDNLTHYETTKHKMHFTGKTPTDRANYVGKSKKGWNCGENCLYFTSAILKEKLFPTLEQKS